MPLRHEQFHGKGPWAQIVSPRNRKMTPKDKGGKMPGAVRKNFDSPEETRPFEASSGQVELVSLDGGVVGRATFMPGWRWSEHVKPIAKTDSCQAAHMGYVLSGRQVIHMDDGAELEIRAGDVVSIPAGHDGWTIGDEPCVVLDFSGMADYARR